MTYVIHASPVLMRWLPEEYFENALVLIELEPDITVGGHLRLDLNVVVNRFELRTRSGNERVEWYIGCTGVRIEILAKDAEVTDWTREASLTTEYEVSTNHKRQSSAKIAPRLKRGGTESSFGEFMLSADQQRTFTTKFTGAERLLQPTLFGRKIRWELVMPRGEKAVQDFISANLHLHSEWKPLPVEHTTISVTPITVQWFDHDRRPLGKYQKHLADFFLWLDRKRRVYFADGVDCELTLEVHADD